MDDYRSSSPAHATLDNLRFGSIQLINLYMTNIKGRCVDCAANTVDWLVGMTLEAERWFHLELTLNCCFYCSVKRAVCSLQCAVCSEQWTVCTVCTVQCAVCSASMARPHSFPGLAAHLSHNSRHRTGQDPVSSLHTIGARLTYISSQSFTESVSLLIPPPKNSPGYRRH